MAIGDEDVTAVHSAAAASVLYPCSVLLEEYHSGSFVAADTARRVCLSLEISERGHVVCALHRIGSLPLSCDAKRECRGLECRGFERHWMRRHCPESHGSPLLSAQYARACVA